MQKELVLIPNTKSTKNDFCLEFLYKNKGKKDEVKVQNPLTFEEQTILIDKILNNIFSVVIDGKKEIILHIGEGKILHIDRTLKNFRVNLHMVYRELVTADGLETINLEKLFELIKSRPPYSYSKSLSLFHKQNRLVINEEEQELINEIKLNYEFAGTKIEPAIFNEIVEEINKHWRGYIPQIIDHIVAGKYATDKKNLWLLIMANSNFGKSKLFKWIEKFGGSAFVDFEDLGNSGISDKDPKEFLGKQCLVIDEVLKFNRAMFKIEEYLMVRPMRNHSVKVPIGTRIMLSADGGIFNSSFLDDQIKNRVAKIDLREYETEDLGQLEITKKYGEYQIEKSMELYLYTEMINRISEYEKLNDIDRANKAEQTIKSIFKENKFEIVNFFEKVEEVIYEILENRDILDDVHKQILNDATIRVDNRNYKGFLIQRPTNVIPRVLISYDNTLEHELKYKEIQQIADKINTMFIPKNGIKIDGRKYRGLFVEDKITEPEIVYETIDKEAEEVF